MRSIILSFVCWVKELLFTSTPYTKEEFVTLLKRTAALHPDIFGYGYSHLFVMIFTAPFKGGVWLGRFNDAKPYDPDELLAVVRDSKSLRAVLHDVVSQNSEVWTSEDKMKIGPLYDMLYVKPLEQMPFYMTDERMKTIAEWRLEIGK